MLHTIGLIIGITLLYATPLIFAALGGVITENSGVVNIGLEGMMTVGAFAGATAAAITGNPWIGFLAAGLAGAVLSLLHAVAAITLKADQVVSGIAINFFGSGISIFLARLIFGSTDTTTLQPKEKVPFLFDVVFPRNTFFSLIFRQYATTYLAFIFVFLSWFLLYKTKIGLRIRGVGEHPRAADTLGVNVYRIRYLAVLLSGILAGFGGAAKSLAISSFFGPVTIAGQGFIALAAMIFGKWKPQGAMWACLLFGFANGLQIVLGGEGGIIHLPTQILAMTPYVITLLVLMSFVGKAVAPAALGTPYEKGER